MRPTLVANMLIRALVRGLNCCGGTWAGCSGCLRKFFIAMPAQDLHYHTSSKLALVAHNGSRAHVTILHKAYHQNLTHLRRQLPVLRRQSRPRDYVTRRVHRHLLGVSRFALPSCPSFPTEICARSEQRGANDPGCQPYVAVGICSNFGDTKI